MGTTVVTPPSAQPSLTTLWMTLNAVDGYAGDPDNDATCDTIYDTTACTTCDATMRPSCSVEYCLAGLDEIDDAAPTSSCPDGLEKKKRRR